MKQGEVAVAPLHRSMPAIGLNKENAWKASAFRAFRIL
jgi:hypothetical protein